MKRLPHLAGLILGVLAALAPVAALSAPTPPNYLKRLSLPATTDAFRWPYAVHADLHTGEVFVCDQFNNRLVIFDQAGLYSYQIHGGSVFQTPLDVAVFPEGQILLLGYVGQERHFLILDFDGKFINEIALSGLPEGALTPEPVSLALSPAGDRMYVLDQANLTLWIADLKGQISRSLNFSIDAQTNRPSEELFGHVDVYGDTLLLSLPMEGHVNLYSLDGDLHYSVGLKGTSACQTAFPVAAALDSEGNLIILDKQRTLIMVWRPAGNDCLMEFSGIGTSPGALYSPADLCLDGQGRVYVSQGFEGRVQVFVGAAPAAGSRAASSPASP